VSKKEKRKRKERNKEYKQKHQHTPDNNTTCIGTPAIGLQFVPHNATRAIPQSLFHHILTFAQKNKEKERKKERKKRLRTHKYKHLPPTHTTHYTLHLELAG
jgi:hypothetical protein